MRVVLGVTGCIAAYKSAFILRLLQENGCQVVAVMTSSAHHFITPLTLEKLSGNRVISDLFEDGGTEIEHISVARGSDLLLVAPATANILAKFARGIADDFLSTLYVSTTTPVVVAPAMNVEMWRHPATRENLEILSGRRVAIVEPGAGYLACGEVGEGRLAEPEQIVETALRVVKASGSLTGRKVLVTAGPTVEDIDAARFISNRSTGKMGYAIAEEAARRGAEVVLVSGPSQLGPPWGVERVDVRSGDEMAEAVLARFDAQDIVVMAAAVSDFRCRISEGKIKKSDFPESLRLEPTTDILLELGRRKREQFLVGFAAESEDLVQNARNKILKKNLDLIVANDISRRDAGFAADTNQVSLIAPGGDVEESSLAPKSEIAGFLWDRIERYSARKPGVTA